MAKDAEKGNSFGWHDGIGGAPEGVSLPLKYQGRILYNLCRNLIFTERDDEDDNSADVPFVEYVLDPLPFDLSRGAESNPKPEYYCAANGQVAVKIRKESTIIIILKDPNSGDEKSFFTLDPDGEVGVLETRLPLHDLDPRACHELLMAGTTLVTNLFEEQKKAVMDKQIFAVREHLAPFFDWKVLGEVPEKS